MAKSANRKIQTWIDQETPEPVIEPEIPIIDPHHHLWDLRSFTTEPFTSFEQKVYLCEDIVSDIEASGHNVVQTVFAQCNAFYRASGPEQLRCVGETEFVHGIYAMTNSGVYGDLRLCTGIFSAADLRLGSHAEAVIEAHLDASANFRGVRTGFPRDLNEQFLTGFSVLARHNLSFDHYSPDISRLYDLAKLANKFPDVPIIVNHLGGRIDANASDEAFTTWCRAIDHIAACPNAYMKCGGGQQRVGPDWEPDFHMHQRDTPIGSEELAERLYRYYAYAIETFGPDRCMFESNFPVDKECVSYRNLWNAFKRIAGRMGLSEAEKANLFAGTAAKAYRLTF